MGKLDAIALIILIYVKVGQDILQHQITTFKERRSWIKKAVKKCMHVKS